MSLFTGVFAAETENPAELNKRSFAAKMLELYPNGSFPLWGLLSQQPKAKAVSSTHGYFTKTIQFGSVTINDGAGYAAGDVTFTVDSSTGIVAKQVLYNPRTKENLRVSSVTNSTTIVVTRAFGRQAAAAILDNDVLIVIGTAHDQGSDRPTARGMTTVYVPNYTQIFRNAWALTDTARASAVEMGMTNIARTKRDCAILHSIDCESAIFFGQPKMDTTGTNPLHATQGIIDAVDQYAPANTNDAAATTTYDQLITLIESAFNYSTDLGNTKERVAFCGSTAMKVLNGIGRFAGTVTISQEETSFGMMFTRFKFYKGIVNLIEHPMFNSHDELKGMMVLCELAGLQLAFMEGRDTRPEEFGGTGQNNANGVDAEGGSLTTEFAVELINPFAYSVIYGLTAAAA